MSSNVQDDRFAPPRAHVEDLATADEGTQLATRGSCLHDSIAGTVVLKN